MSRKKILTVLSVVVIIFVVVFATVIYYTNSKPQSTSNQLPFGEVPEWQIKLTGDVEQEKTITLNDLVQMPLSNVTTEDNSTIYIGVSLFDFCNQTGMAWDAMGIQVTGENDKTATINLYQAWNSTLDTFYGNNINVTRSNGIVDHIKYEKIILAFVKNGQWMTNKTDAGVVQLITPNFNESYQIASVSKINLIPWAITINGKVANPVTLTAQNLTLIKSTTINATTFYSGFNSVTANWTGILIMDALAYANVSEYASQVTLVGIDGKACLGVSVVGNFTFEELQSGKMMIGYQQNGKTLTVDNGGPYKSFCPTTDPPFRISTYWMKWLSEIIVY